MSLQILNGDCRDILQTLADKSVHCCVTSPPYFGLRDYGCSGQIGLEATPGEYVAALAQVFREVHRVLRDDGTLWLNLGDSYSNGGRKTRDTDDKLGARAMDVRPNDGGKPKDLLGIPWRVAFALQDAGWYLRSDIIWSKPNPMPESVTDRPTKAHEYLFLLAKAEKYFYDHEAIKEQAVCGWNGSQFHTGKTADHQLGRSQKVRPSAKKGTFSGKTESMAATGQNAFRAVTETRNKRTVWEVATKPYKGAHFAVFPAALVTPCILAGCPEGGTVLDPFGGSGTTGRVAVQHRRNAILIELNPEYIGLQQQRTSNVQIRAF